jgi:hypothetical protein
LDSSHPENQEREKPRREYTSDTRAVSQQLAAVDHSHARVRPVLWGALISFALLLVFLLLLTLPVSSTDFRLMARSEVFGLELADHTQFSVKVREWSVRHADTIEFSTGDAPNSKTKDERLSLAPVASRSKKQRGFAEIIVSAPPKAQLRLISTRGAKNKFRIDFAGAPAEVSIQMPTSVSELLIDGDKGGPRRTKLSGIATVKTMASGTVLDFDPQGESILALILAVPVTKFGFARPQTDATIVPGLLEGEIQFLDLPNSQLSLFPGSDVRFRVNQATVDRLDLTVNGINTSISGKAEGIELFIGKESRSLLPKWWDRIRNLPETNFFLMILSGVATVVTLIVAIIDNAPRFVKFLRGPQRPHD